MGSTLREPTWFSGERFEAAVSVNRTLADIIDRKTGDRMILLDTATLSELRDLVDELLEFMRLHQE